MMEPMTLGSPGSPSNTSSGYLPAFLMGDPITPVTPRNTTLSPTKGRSLAFAQSPSAVLSPDMNRSHHHHQQGKSLLGYQPTPPTSIFNTSSNVNHNASISGPPTMGLFDSLRAEKNAVQTPQGGSGIVSSSAYQQPSQQMALNQSFQYNQSFNDSYVLNQSGFNTSRIQSPIPNMVHSDYRGSGGNVPSMPSACLSPKPKQCDFWITVYGFPPTATSMILSHFSQCGTIVDQIFPPASGNWVHLKYTSRLECDKALNYNEKILGNCLMIGVTRCKDPSIVDKENQDLNESNMSMSRVRPLAHIAYQSAQSPTDVAPNPTAPKRSSGFVNKAMDLFFGW